MVPNESAWEKNQGDAVEEASGMEDTSPRCDNYRSSVLSFVVLARNAMVHSSARFLDSCDYGNLELLSSRETPTKHPTQHIWMEDME